MSAIRIHLLSGPGMWATQVNSIKAEVQTFKLGIINLAELKDMQETAGHHDPDRPSYDRSNSEKAASFFTIY